MPLLHLLAGPNGSGKSSYIDDLLHPITHLPVINADEIAAARWPDDAAAHSYEAAQIAASQRRTYLNAHRSFITETVFSHPSKVDLARAASDLGYLVHLHIILIPVELSVQRVVERVRRGGHTVPEQKIRDRHARLWTHVAEAIAIADTTEVLDNTRADRPFRPIVTYQHGVAATTPHWPTWAPSALVATTH